MHSSDLGSVDLSNRYQLGEILGEGAMATVYEAWDRLRQQPVAVKVLKDPHDTIDIARLWVEMRSLQRVQCPSIIRTLDMGKSRRGLSYIVMELLQGRTQRAVLQERGRLEMHEAVPLLLQMAGALQACHLQGVIHRDVKPENVFLLAPEEQQLKLIDFGMAKILYDTYPSVTMDSVIFGTPEYMAPERISGSSPTRATDIYALGVVAFEMLAGERPFRGDTPETIMRQHLRQPVPRFSELDSPLSIPRRLRELVRRCLRKLPAQRPTADTICKSLGRIQAKLLVS